MVRGRLTPEKVSRLRDKIETDGYWKRRLRKLRFAKEEYNGLAYSHNDMVFYEISEEYARKLPFYQKKIEEGIELELSLTKDTFKKLGVPAEKLTEVFGIKIPESWTR